MRCMYLNDNKNMKSHKLIFLFIIKSGDQIFIRTIRDIAAGEELTITYGVFFGYTEPRGQRQIWLRQRFDFDCACVACCDRGGGLENKLYMVLKS
jgi:SET domain-containing protein